MSAPARLDDAGVFVVLVNYRRPDLTEDAVASLRCCGAPVEIVLVDNGSDDGSLARLRRSCADCAVLDAGGNLGFSGGNNVGIRHALAHGARWILLLNNDTLVEPGFLAPLLSAAGDHALATPRIVLADDPSRIWYGGGRVDRARGGFYHETDAARAAEARDVTFASACCLLLPASFFRECGEMDESFFLYYEDAELCLRAARNGYRIRYEPASTIRHRVGASTGGERSAAAIYYGTRNRLALLARYGFPLRARVFVVLSRMVHLARAPFRRASWSVVPGLLDVLRGRLGKRGGDS